MFTLQKLNAVHWMCMVWYIFSSYLHTAIIFLYFVIRVSHLKICKRSFFLSMNHLTTSSYYYVHGQFCITGFLTSFVKWKAQSFIIFIKALLHGAINCCYNCNRIAATFECAIKGLLDYAINIAATWVACKKLHARIA